jgi:cytochrome oxidase Cu insertion factor (SCO1/SenC/PrrC family)
MTDTMKPSRTGTSTEGRVDRATAFAAGPTRIPRKFVWTLLGAAAVLGVGGALLEHVLDAAGVNPTPTTTMTTLAPRPFAAEGEREAVVPGELAAFMGLNRMTPGEARSFSLVDERSRTVSLADERGKVVVLTFFDGRCNDICPVLAAEIVQADRDLGAASGRVGFLTVNTDPAATAVSGLQDVLVKTALGRLPNWHMATGPLSDLNTVWQSYGITVSFNAATRTVEHNDVMYFLDVKGRFEFSATPFANERRPSGTYELPRDEITRFATGIATYARQLADNR